MQYLNLSGYQFIKLTNLVDLRTKLKDLCKEIGLKGTILIGNEGINVFVAGNQETINKFYQALKQCNLPDLEFKVSFSADIPFKRMLVKIKPEIISMGVSSQDHEAHVAPHLSAQEFKKWLDEGKDVVILDTRNDYETHLGKFKGAIELNIDHFRQFPQACESLPKSLKDKTVVTYCTGGIRCEKAAPLLKKLGFKDVYQLDGGIVKYFEECGNAHYEGECFVFDKRISVDHTLHETDTVQCYKCRMPVIPSKQTPDQYKENEYCPSCL